MNNSISQPASATAATSAAPMISAVSRERCGARTAVPMSRTVRGTAPGVALPERTSSNLVSGRRGIRSGALGSLRQEEDGVIVDDRPAPIVLAPLAGGPSTAALAAAVSGAGGLGFLGAGYLTAERLDEDIGATRRLTGEPFGVNLFVPGPPSSPGPAAASAATLADEAARADVRLGDPRWSDDAWPAKLDLLAGDPVAVVS